LNEDKKLCEELLTMDARKSLQLEQCVTSGLGLLSLCVVLVVGASILVDIKKVLLLSVFIRKVVI